LGNMEIEVICYADDAVLIAETKDNLQKLLLSTRKIGTTKSMTIAKDPIKCELNCPNKGTGTAMWARAAAPVYTKRNLQGSPQNGRSQ